MWVIGWRRIVRDFNTTNHHTFRPGGVHAHQQCSDLPADRQPDKAPHSLRSLSWMVLLGVTGTPVTAHATQPPAEHPTVVLGYERSGTALKACPDEATFRALVAARLGYDAFVDGGGNQNTLALRVEFRRLGALVSGSLQLTAHGAPRGGRTISAAPADCYELAASLALAAAVAVDPQGALAQNAGTAPGQPPPSSEPAAPSIAPLRTPPPTSPEPAPSTSSPPPLLPPFPPAETTTRAGFLNAGAVVSVGIQPGPAPGVRIGGGLRSGAWSVGLEMVAFLPSEREQPFGTASAQAFYGSLLPCGHRGWTRLTVDVCAIVSVGALFSHAEGVTRSRTVTDRYTTVGARVGLTLRASDAWSFTLNAEAPIALSRVHLVVDDAGVNREAWAANRVGFIGAAGMELKLP